MLLLMCWKYSNKCISYYKFSVGWCFCKECDVNCCLIGDNYLNCVACLDLPTFYDPPPSSQKRCFLLLKWQLYLIFCSRWKLYTMHETTLPWARSKQEMYLHSPKRWIRYTWKRHCILFTPQTTPNKQSCIH